MAYTIDKNKCLGCGACAFMCLFDVPAAVNADASLYEIDAEKCLGCGQCENICPVGAVSPAPGHKKIKRVYINAENCIGCGLCAANCRASAITGVIKSPFTVNEDRCFRCGLCATKCRKDAIVIEYE